MSGNISLINDFELLEKIISSHFSETFKCKHKQSNKIYSIKRYSQEQLSKTDSDIGFQREKSVLFDITRKSYPNVLKLYNSFEDTLYRYLLFEYCEGQNLENYISAQKDNIEEKTIIHILKELLKTLSFLHEECFVMHRNIKPNNIIIDKNNNIKLIGFHLSAYLKNKNRHLVSNNSFKGHIKYVPPEILHGNNNVGTYDAKCDIFSLGYTIYYLMNKDLPSETKIGKGFYSRENKPLKNNNYSPWLIQFVQLLYSDDKTKRPTASQALKLLEDNLNKQNI